MQGVSRSLAPPLLDSPLFLRASFPTLKRGANDRCASGALSSRGVEPWNGISPGSGGPLLACIVLVSGKSRRFAARFMLAPMALFTLEVTNCEGAK
jgi:hypothetical protein